MTSRTRPFPRRARKLLAVVGALAVAATACGSDNRASSASSSAASATTATASAAPATTAAIPKNLTLTVADQSGAVATPFGLAKAGDGAPYKVKFADFNGGAAAIEALRAGAADLAYVGEAPVPIAADSGINDLVAVAAAANPGSSGNYYLVVKPDSPIKTVADLEGKKIAYPPGTGRQMILAGILQSNGMSLTGGDVQGVQLAGTEVAPTFAAGAVDAAMVLGAQYFKVGEPRILADGTGHNFGMSLLITTRKTLDDAAKMAAIGDFVERAAHAENYKAAHVDEYIDADYVAKQGITHAQGRRLLDEAGVDSYYPIDDALIGAFQQVADNLRTSGVVKNHFDAASAVDDRFNALVVAQNERDGVTPKPLEP
jgi:ABC-type nitrate/sulfonate/bicarbonate transport system substrate-binding protein